MGFEDEKQMANYGLVELSPCEAAGQWKELVHKEALIHKNHKTTVGESEKRSRIPYFTHGKTYKNLSTYDHMFHIEHDYNSKVHRDDRQHTVGLNVGAEELSRTAPVLSSSAYGRRVADNPFVDTETLRKHVRIERVMKGFYRDRGTGLPPRNDSSTGH